MSDAELYAVLSHDFGVTVEEVQGWGREQWAVLCGCEVGVPIGADGQDDYGRAWVEHSRGNPS